MDDVDESRRATRGDVAAADAPSFSRFVGEHLPVLAAVAANEVGLDDAEDVVQEAFIRAWRRRETFDARRGSARGWLVAIVMDQARRHRTRERRTGSLDVASTVDLPEERLDLQRAIDSLPRRQRQVITLYYLADLPVSEVAALLEISEGTVKSTLSDARHALHDAVEQRR